MDIDITDLKIIMTILFGCIAIYGLLEMKFTSLDLRYLLALIWFSCFLTIGVLEVISVTENQNQNQNEIPTCQK